jgi:hypothetical protein
MAECNKAVIQRDDEVVFPSRLCELEGGIRDLDRLDTSKYPLRCSLGEQDHRLRPWRSLLMRPDDRLEAAGAALC